jgi:hypothetical protein
MTVTGNPDVKNRFVTGAFNQAYACLLFFYALKMEQTSEALFLKKLAGEFLERLNEVKRSIIEQNTAPFLWLRELPPDKQGMLSKLQVVLERIGTDTDRTVFHKSFLLYFAKIPFKWMESDIGNCDDTLCLISTALEKKLEPFFGPRIGVAFESCSRREYQHSKNNFLQGMPQKVLTATLFLFLFGTFPVSIPCYLIYSYVL